MIHRILTCANHPNLRWSTKDIAWTEAKDDTPGHYNGSRRLGFRGTPTGKGMYTDRSGLDCTQFKDGEVVMECDCPLTALMLAPEDALVSRE